MSDISDFISSCECEFGDLQELLNLLNYLLGTHWTEEDLDK